jgi:predicted nucleic acid-binding protein
VVIVNSSALAKYILREEGWEKVRGFLEKDKVYFLFNAVIEVSNTV